VFKYEAGFSLCLFALKSRGVNVEKTTPRPPTPGGINELMSFGENLLRMNRENRKSKVKHHFWKVGADKYGLRTIM
jgi:hypothetical protein